MIWKIPVVSSCVCVNLNQTNSPQYLLWCCSDLIITELLKLFCVTCLRNKHFIHQHNCNSLDRIHISVDHMRFSYVVISIHPINLHLAFISTFFLYHLIMFYLHSKYAYLYNSLALYPHFLQVFSNPPILFLVGICWDLLHIKW